MAADKKGGGCTEERCGGDDEPAVGEAIDKARKGDDGGVADHGWEGAEEGDDKEE